MAEKSVVLFRKFGPKIKIRNLRSQRSLCAVMDDPVVFVVAARSKHMARSFSRP